MKDENKNKIYAGDLYQMDQLKDQEINAKQQIIHDKKKKQETPFFSKNDLVKGIIMKEILGKPKGRRK